MGVMQVMRSLLMAQPHRESIVGTGGLATFDDDFKGLMKLSVPFSPVQDLHGYDHPWPAGGGKNLFDKTDTSKRIANSYLVAGEGALCRNVSTINDTRIVWINCEPNTTYTASCNVTTTLRLASFESFPTANRTEASVFNAPSPTTTIPAGVGISLTTGANDSYLLVQVFADGDMGTITFEAATNKLMIEKGTTVTSYTPYANICPIEGMAECTVEHANQGALFDRYGFINSNGSISANVGYYLCDYYDVSDSDTVYYHITNRRGYYFTIYAYDENKQPLRTLYQRLLPSGETKEYFGTVNVQDVSYVRMCFNTGNTDGWLVTRLVTIPITFTDQSTGDPITLYGGTLTLNEDGSADLVCPFGYVEYDGSEDEAWLYETTGFGYKNAYIRPPSDFKSNQRTVDELKCSICDTGTEIRGGRTSVAKDKCYISVTPFLNFALLDTLGMSSAAEFRAWLQNGHTMQVVGTLSSPKTYHFDNVGQLKSFLGQNNVWTDLNGDPTVTYWKRG